MASLCASIHCGDVEMLSVSGAASNPHKVVLGIGQYGCDASVFMTPEVARRMAALLIADATRCETWHAERALARQAEPAEEPLDEVVF